MNKLNKSIILIFGTLFLMINTSCDNRIPDAAASTNATLQITALQAIARETEESVGEIVSGHAKMRIVAVLQNESGEALKDKEITYSHNGSGGIFSQGSTAKTDENKENQKV